MRAYIIKAVRTVDRNKEVKLLVFKPKEPLPPVPGMEEDDFFRAEVNQYHIDLAQFNQLPSGGWVEISIRKETSSE